MKNRPIVIGLFCTLLLAACTMRTPLERRQDRRCDKAERLITKAVYKCPGVLHDGDSATVTFTETVAGDSLLDAADWLDLAADNDSLIAIAHDLNRALLFLDSARMADNFFAEQIANAQVKNTRAAMRRQVCVLPTVHWSDSVCSGSIWIEADGIHYTHKRKPQYITRIVREKCPPCITRTPSARQPTALDGDQCGAWGTAAITGWLVAIALAIFLWNEKSKRPPHAQPERSAT